MYTAVEPKHVSAHLVRSSEGILGNIYAGLGKSGHASASQATPEYRTFWEYGYSRGSGNSVDFDAPGLGPSCAVNDTQ